MHIAFFFSFLFLRHCMTNGGILWLSAPGHVFWLGYSLSVVRYLLSVVCGGCTCSEASHGCLMFCQGRFNELSQWLNPEHCGQGHFFRGERMLKGVVTKITDCADRKGNAREKKRHFSCDLALSSNSYFDKYWLIHFSVKNKNKLLWFQPSVQSFIETPNLSISSVKKLACSL